MVELQPAARCTKQSTVRPWAERVSVERLMLFLRADKGRSHHWQRIKVLSLKGGKVRLDSGLTDLYTTRGSVITKQDFWYTDSEEDHAINHHCAMSVLGLPCDSGDSQNFQNLSKTELCTASLVFIVSALFAITSKIGQMHNVRLATRMTGASELMAAATLGSFARKSCSGLMNPAMLVNDDRAQRTETGKIYRVVRSPSFPPISGTGSQTHPDEGKHPYTDLDHPFPDKFRAVYAHRQPRPKQIRPIRSGRRTTCQCPCRMGSKELQG